MVELISDFGPRGGLASTVISRGNKLIPYMSTLSTFLVDNKSASQGKGSAIDQDLNTTKV
jgi:hypothetical protein